MTTTSREKLEAEVKQFLDTNFPQIQMHGGSAEVTFVDEEDGRVGVKLGDACSGCGISPMTVQAIKKRLPLQLPPIHEVVVDMEEEGDITDGPFA